MFASLAKPDDDKELHWLKVCTRTYLFLMFRYSSFYLNSIYISVVFPFSLSFFSSLSRLGGSRPLRLFLNLFVFVITFLFYFPMLLLLIIDVMYQLSHLFFFASSFVFCPSELLTFFVHPRPLLTIYPLLGRPHKMYDRLRSLITLSSERPTTWQ